MMADISSHVKILDDIKDDVAAEVQTLRGVYEDPTTNVTIVCCYISSRTS